MKWIVLLRGVNVGGKGKLPMNELREKMMARDFCETVATYIQSGNILLDSALSDADEVATSVQSVIEEEFGFVPHILALSVAELERAADGNHYKEAESTPKYLHLYFLEEQPAEPDLNRLEGKKAAAESFTLGDKVFYLHAPDGIGRSKLAADVERALGVAATARNWKSVSKLLEMSSQ